jgi:ABC-type transport system substrate-binding protein
LQQLMFNGLLEARMVRIGNRYDLMYVGVLAKNYSSNGNTFVFRLNDQARFHDRTPVTGDDVYSTIRALISPQTELGDTFYRNYIDSVEALGDQVTVRLRRIPYNKLDLFTFGVMQDAQLAEPLRLGFSRQAQGSNWQKLAIIRHPIGTGPFMLPTNADVPMDLIDRLRLVRFNQYFDRPTDPAKAGNIQDITFSSYATLKTTKQEEDLRAGARINIGMQTYTLPEDQFILTEYGQDAVYYIGFNFGDPANGNQKEIRRVHVVTPNSRGSALEFRPLGIKLSDILQAPDVIAGETTGRMFRRLLAEGINRVALLEQVVGSGQSGNLPRRLQTSIFPAGPFPEQARVRETAERYFPAAYTSNVANQLNQVLKRNLSDRGLPWFEYTPSDKLSSFFRAMKVSTAEGLPPGLFALNTNPNQVLSLTMIYINSDRVFTQDEVVRTSLTNAFLQMGIYLKLEAVNEFEFSGRVRKGDWDLVLSSYRVPQDYNVASVFSRQGISKLDVLGANLTEFIHPEVEAAAQAVALASTENGYRSRLEDLNDAVIRQLPAIFLFGLGYKAGFPRQLLQNDVAEFRLLVSNRHFFGQTERWRLR